MKTFLALALLLLATVVHAATGIPWNPYNVVIYKGDLLVYDGTNMVRIDSLHATDGQVLTVSHSASNGFTWSAGGGGGSTGAGFTNASFYGVTTLATNWVVVSGANNRLTFSNIVTHVWFTQETNSVFTIGNTEYLNSGTAGGTVLLSAKDNGEAGGTNTLFRIHAPNVHGAQFDGSTNIVGSLEISGGDNDQVAETNGGSVLIRGGMGIGIGQNVTGGVVRVIGGLGDYGGPAEFLGGNANDSIRGGNALLKGGQGQSGGDANVTGGDGTDIIGGDANIIGGSGGDYGGNIRIKFGKGTNLGDGFVSITGGTNIVGIGGSLIVSNNATFQAVVTGNASGLTNLNGGFPGEFMSDTLATNYGQTFYFTTNSQQGTFIAWKPGLGLVQSNTVTHSASLIAGTNGGDHIGGWTPAGAGNLIVNGTNAGAYGVFTQTVTALSVYDSGAVPSASNQLVNFAYVQGLFDDGFVGYMSTNLDSVATNVDSVSLVYKYQSIAPAQRAVSYAAPTNGQYIATAITTNLFTQVSGPMLVDSFIGMSGIGTLASVLGEMDYSYDRTNWFGAYASQAQTIILNGTNLYQFLVTFPNIISTNATGFYVQRRLKLSAITGVPTITVWSGTNTADHVSFFGPNSANGNATLAGNNAFTSSNNFAGPLTVGAGATYVITNVVFVSGPTFGVSSNGTGSVTITNGTNFLVAGGSLSGAAVTNQIQSSGDVGGATLSIGTNTALFTLFTTTLPVSGKFWTNNTGSRVMIECTLSNITGGLFFTNYTTGRQLKRSGVTVWDSFLIPVGTNEYIAFTNAGMVFEPGCVAVMKF